LTEWRFAFAGAGLSFFGLKDYSQRQGLNQTGFTGETLVPIMLRE
jgi:hypothetical protein